jgi:two-component system, OmpR family, response regulator
MSQSKPKHILLVEDYNPVRELTAAVLEDRGYRVSTAQSGASMRDFLRTHDCVDAIVLDAVTAGEEGASLARRAEDSGFPVVMTSGSPVIISFAAEHGLQLLRKPFRAEELYAALDKALSSREFGEPPEATANDTQCSRWTERRRASKLDRAHVIEYR